MMVLALTAACGSPGGAGGLACLDIGMPVGIGLDISAPAAATIASARMEACWAGTCTARPVELSPSTGPVGTGCAGSGLSGMCSAQTAPTGGKSGFADFPGLPATPIRVTVTFDGGRARSLDVTPSFSRPGGPGCESLGPQAHLVVGADLELIAR